jgi:molecular chaperone IbpA
MTLSFNPMYHSMLGFDKLFDELNRLSDAGAAQKSAISFPPHNVLKISDDRYVIELAVAGFTEEDIEITLTNGSLVVTGNKQDKIDPKQYLFKGIGARKFTKSFRVAETVEVRGAEFVNGVLRIGLEDVVSDKQKAKTISINKSLPGFYPSILEKELN